MTRIFEALKRRRQEINDQDEEGRPAESPIAAPAESDDYEDLELSSEIGAPAGPVLRQAPVNPRTIVLQVDRIEEIAISHLHPRLIMLTQPLAPECEQFKTLRTRIFHDAQKKDVKVLTVSSAIAGEGKTSTALNLAIAIAQSKEKRVLVIDGDLRRPNISAYLGLRVSKGLGELLSSQCDLKEAVIRLETAGLDILPASRETENPTEALSSSKLAETIATLRDYYDFILIDSPPVLPFADAGLLANHSDSVLLVIRAGMADYDTIEKAIDSLPAGRILGVVLNGAENIRDTGYYDYYYNYSDREKRRQRVRDKAIDRIRRSFIGRIMRL